MIGFKTSDRKKKKKSRILDSLSSAHATRQVFVVGFGASAKVCVVFGRFYFRSP